MNYPKTFRFSTAVLFAASLMARSEVQLDFTHSYSGAAGAFQNTGAITLAFSVDGSGGVTLDASCAQAGPATYVDDFDGSVGTVSDPGMFGMTFTMTLTQVTGSGALRVDNAGKGLAIQGRNAQRIDDPSEGIDFALTGVSSDFELREVSFDNATTSAGSLLDVDATSYPISAVMGSIDVTAQGVVDDFTISSASDTQAQGFVLSSLKFELSAPPLNKEFDNDGGDSRWATLTNWNSDGLPLAPADALIDGFDVLVDSAIASGPEDLEIKAGSLTLRNGGSLAVDSMVVGRELENAVNLTLEGANVSLSHSGNGAGTFAVGSATTVTTLPDAGGSGSLDLGAGELILDLGSEWFLDGSDYTGPTTVGTRFVLANFGSFSGSTMGLQTKNFDLPANRNLKLVTESDSIYYEIEAQTAAAGPNIIIINVDDIVGGQHFGFEGRDCLTPAIDGLAAGGINFTEAFAASTVCGPSRYALLSGRWPSRNTSANFLSKFPVGTLDRFGVSDTELEDDGENIGAWLQQAGYRTGFVGKAHVWDDDYKFTSNWASKGLITYPKIADPAVDSAVNGAMKHNHRVLSQRMQTVGFDFVSGFYSANLLELRNDHLNVHNQEWITKNALDFIEENHEQRFFLYMAPTVNHGPVRDDLGKTIGADPRYTGEGFIANPDFTFMPTRQEIRDEVVGAGKQLISARETWIDYSIAALQAKLAQHNLTNDTLIIFTSDHGEKALNVSPTDWGKSSLNDLGMRVPLVMNWPNGIASGGRVYSELVSQVDFVPTLLELAGVSNLPTRPIDGVSLVPVFNGSSAPLREEVFCELGYARAVRTKTSKYIALRYSQAVHNKIENGDLFPKHGTGELIEPRPYYTNNSSLGFNVSRSSPNYFDDDQVYDLQADPDEETNVYTTSPEVAHDLKKRLAGYLEMFPDRPFRHFSGSESEFAPAPAASPLPPGAVLSEFLDLQNVRLNWNDTSDDELGYLVEQSNGGGDFEIVAELPAGSTTRDVTIDPAEEDVVFRVSAYNARGDSAAVDLVDLLSPDDWRYRTFGDIDPNLENEVSQWSFDADGDGVATIWEYAYGTNPRASSSVTNPSYAIREVGADSFLEFRVPKLARRQVDIVCATSLNLTMWNSGPVHCPVVKEGDEHLLFRSVTPIADEAKQFIRAEVTEP